MVVIVAQIRNFRYFLRLDKNGEVYAEGLVNNATEFTDEAGERMLKYAKSEWTLTIEYPKQLKINNKRKNGRIH